MAVVRLDKMAGTHLASVRHNAVLTNGLFVQLGGLVAGEKEAYNVKVASTDADVTEGEFLLHATPEVMADPRKAGLKNFEVEAGKEARAYHLTKGDIVTITADQVEGTLVVGEFAVPQHDSLKLTATTDGTILDSAGSASIKPSLQLQVIEQTTLGYDNASAYAFRVVDA